MRRAAIGVLLLILPATALSAEEEGNHGRQAAQNAGAAAIAGRDPGAAIEADQLSKPPKLTKQAKIDYPKEAIGKAGEVEVTLLVDLDEKGAVVGAAVEEPKIPTGLGFEEAALTAAYDLSFESAEVAGKPVAVQIVYKFKFVPPKPPVPQPDPPAEPGNLKPAPVENFSGVLVERGTRLPLGGVLVTVYRTEGEAATGFEATTDEQGAFHFYDLAPGTWKVRIEPSAYYPIRTSEEIAPGERTNVTYYVERGSYNPFDVVVEAKRERKEVSRTVIESAVIEKVPGAMGDALAVVQNFAGVARAQAFSGQIMIRGSGPHDTAYFLDGMSIPLVYHFGGFRSVIPTGMIDNLQFYPGNFSPYYSGVNGGIIDIELKKAKPKRVGGYVDLNLLDGGFYLEIPFGEKLTVALAARRSWIDKVISAAMPSDVSFTSLQLPRYYDYQLSATYRPAPAHELRLFLFASDDRFEMVSKNGGAAGSAVVGNEFQYATGFYRALASYKFVPSEHFENLIRLSQGRDSQNIEMSNLIMDYQTDSTQFRDTARYQWSKRLAMSMGADFRYVRVNGLFNVPRFQQEGQTASTDLSKTYYEKISGHNYYTAGLFAELELRPLAHWLVAPGIRFDHWSETSQSTAAPRLTTRYDLSSKLTLKGGIGLFYQQPTLEQIDKVLGNPDLKNERAIHYSGGLEWRPLKNITLDVTGFYKDMSNMVSTTQSSLNGDLTAQPYDNHGKGRAYGLELVAKHDLTKRFSGWLAYTLMRSERMDSGTDDWRLFEYDQTDILTLVGTCQLPRNWQIGGRFRYVTGNPSTSAVSSTFDASTNQYTAVYGTKYSSRVPAFHQLDIRLDKTWIYNKWIFTAYVDLQNVYDRSNPEQLRYNYNYQKSQYSTGLPIYPIIGLRGEL